MAESSYEEREAAYGEHMLVLQVRFWTDGLATGKNIVRPHHGWTSGSVRIEANRAHGITPGKAVMFNSLAEIPRAVERALIANQIVLHPDKERRYIAPDATKARPGGR